MNGERFFDDYGVIPQSFLRLSTVRNATELLWSDEWERLLRLCGIPEREIDGRASDYERFAALCRAFPLLDGHPMQFYLKSFLGAYFPTLPMPSSDTCVELWREIADKLLQKPCKPTDFLPSREPISCLMSTLEVPELPPSLLPMLNADLFLKDGGTYRAWRERIGTVIQQFCQNGARAVRITLARTFAFVQPDLYHVELALKKPSSAEKDILTWQLFRELCEVCQSLSMTLLVEIHCQPQEAVALLRYAQKNVGLPTVNWSADPAAAREILAFQAEARGVCMNWCLRSGEYLTEDALASAIKVAASCYPAGRLQFLTALDLRFSRFEQKRIAAVLQKSF